ncbi:DUF805 domain-containing protein [Dellaglioa sp. L3N]
MFLIKTYINFFKHYFDFRGKSTRIEFWILFITTNCINSILEIYIYGSNYAFKSFVMSLVMAPRQNILIIPSVKSYLVLLILGLYELAMLIPMISIAFRRANDAGIQKRWYVLILIGKLLIYFIIIKGMINQIVYIVTFMTLSLIQLYVLIKPSKELG